MDTVVRQCDRTGQALGTAPRTTIFARSTGALPSAIAIIRISGPAAGRALVELSGQSLPQPRRASLRTLRDADGGMLDMALTLWLPGPETVTGEDVVELHVHGGRAVVTGVETALAAKPGLEPASAGAFTRRAFENGRLDLTQIEGLSELLAAETARQRAAALVRTEGGMRRRVEDWQQQLLALAARAEATIDFSDESDVAADPALASDIDKLERMLRATLSAPPAERLRDGIRIAIAGPPNAGKSTLLNALVGRAAAITSPIAGTTRDLIEVAIDLDGVPIVFTDTAGLRNADTDPIEAIGIARAHGAVALSDLVLWLGNPDAAPGGNCITVAAKCDIASGASADAQARVSAITGEGMDVLRAIVVQKATAMLPLAGGLTLTASERWQLETAAAALARCERVSEDVLLAEELRAAMRALDHITGTVNTEAMLDVLFARFCIGK